MNSKTILLKLKKDRTLVNGSLYSLFSFFSQGCNFLLLILVAGYILPSDYGKLSIFTTIVTVFNCLVGLNSYGYASVYYFKESLENFKKDFTASIVLYVISLLLFCFIISLLSNDVVAALEMTRPLLFIALVVAFGISIFNIHQDYLRIQEKVKNYGAWSVGNALLNFVLTLIIVIYFGQGWLGRVYSQFFCFTLFLLIAFISFYHSHLFSFSWNWKRYKTISLFGIPLILHLAVIWIRPGIDRYIINYYYSTYEVGIFSFAFNLVSVIVMLGVAFNATSSVSIFKVLGNKELDKSEKMVSLKAIMKKLTKIFLGVSLAYLIFILPISYLFLSKYRPAIPCFLILFIYGVVQGFYIFFANYLMFYKRMRLLMNINVLAIILHIILSLLLTHYSFYATMLVYVFSQSLLLFFSLHYSHKILNIQWLKYC